MVWLKSIHIAALVVWGGMLLYVPILFASHAGASGDGRRFRRLRIISRFSFIFIASPAAVIAIATGTALIFVNNVFDAWMFVKLAAVGVLALLHAVKGAYLTRLHDPKYDIPMPSIAFLLLANTLVISLILALVLAKPRFEEIAFPDWLERPIALF